MCGISCLGLEWINYLLTSYFVYLPGQKKRPNITKGRLRGGRLMNHAIEPPELTSRLEEIHTITIWLESLKSHSPADQKERLLELYREGYMSGADRQSLFTLLQLAGA